MHDFDQSRPSNAEVKNERSYTSSFPIRLHEVHGENTCFFFLVWSPFFFFFLGIYGVTDYRNSYLGFSLVSLRFVLILRFDCLNHKYCLYLTHVFQQIRIKGAPAQFSVVTKNTSLSHVNKVIPVQRIYGKQSRIFYRQGSTVTHYWPKCSCPSLHREPLKSLLITAAHLLFT